VTSVDEFSSSSEGRNNHQGQTQKHFAQSIYHDFRIVGDSFGHGIRGYAPTAGSFWAIHDARARPGRVSGSTVRNHVDAGQGWHSANW